MKAQIIKRKCCNTIYAACVEPHCYTSKTWQKDLRLAVKDGDPIETMDADLVKLDSRKCKTNITHI